MRKNQAFIDQLQTYSQQGMTCAQVRNLTGKSERCIRENCKLHGIELAPGSKANRKRMPYRKFIEKVKAQPVTDYFAPIALTMEELVQRAREYAKSLGVDRTPRVYVASKQELQQFAGVRPYQKSLSITGRVSAWA